MTGRATVAAFACGLCALLLFSCAPRRTALSLDPASVNVSSLMAMVQQRSASVQSISGQGLVTFESNDWGGTASFDLSLRKPDSLLVLLEGPFGIDLGTLFLSREHYLAYNSQENLVVTGTPDGKTIASVIPFELPFDEVVNAFSGTAEISFHPDSVRTYAVDEGMFLIVLAQGSGTSSYWVDHSTQEVARYEIHDRDGELLLQARMSSFSGKEEASVPRRIVLWFPQDDKQISVQYSSLTINPDELSFAYSVPSDARVVKR